jgi:hypothetical protein
VAISGILGSATLSRIIVRDNKSFSIIVKILFRRRTRGFSVVHGQALAQNLNPLEKGKRPIEDKGKGPMEEPNTQPDFWPCDKCAKSGLRWPTCRRGSVCHACAKKVHVALHCRAQWRRISGQGKSEGTLFGNRQPNANGASSSKIPTVTAHNDSFPFSRPDASATIPSTELLLGSADQSSAPPQHQPSPQKSPRAASLKSPRTA